MAIAITQTYVATSPGLTVSFLATGGTPPYTYAVKANGAGGTINSSSGLYIAPASVSSDDPNELYDTIQVTDGLLQTAMAKILVGTPLLLFCEIIQNQLGLAPGRVYLWDQKIFQFDDDNLYVAVSVPSCKPFGNTLALSSSSGLNANQYVNMMATLDIDIISRGPSARDRKEEVLMALFSIYSQQQQEANSFTIGRLPAGSRFINLSDIDGAAIPYRYRISINMQYTVTKVVPVPYFNTFNGPTLATNP